MCILFRGAIVVNERKREDRPKPVFSFFYIVVLCWYMFPAGTKSVSVDEHSTTLTGIMVPSSTIDRTMVYCRISQSGNGDSHISLSNTSTGRTLCDTEGNAVVDSFSPIVIPAGVDVVWDKSSNNTRYAGQVSWVDYNLQSSTDSLSTSTIIGYDGLAKLDILIGICFVLVSLSLLDLLRRLFWRSGQSS